MRRPPSTGSRSGEQASLPPVVEGLLLDVIADGFVVYCCGDRAEYPVSASALIAPLKLPRPIFASALRSVDACTIGAGCDRVKVAQVISLLHRPVYTYSQVDRLLELTSGTARRWINGYRHGRRIYDPIIRPSSRNTTWVTWGEYVEARLLANWRDLDKLPIPKLRKLAEYLRRETGEEFPLATYSMLVPANPANPRGCRRHVEDWL